MKANRGCHRLDQHCEALGGHSICFCTKNLPNMDVDPRAVPLGVTIVHPGDTITTDLSFMR